MRKMIQALNKARIFHSVSAEDIDIRKQPANMPEKGKDMLQKYFGLTDFTVPQSLKSPFDNKASKLIEEMKQAALKKAGPQK